MCLGIPGQSSSCRDNDQLATVEVTGVRRTINIGLLEDEAPRAGDWVLIHVGFAMSKIDEEEAAMALASLQLMGQAYDDEIEACSRGIDARERDVRFVDEYRDPAARPRRCSAITDAGRRRPLQVHGGVRRPHPHHLPPRHRARAAPERGAGARSRLPGVRDPDGPGRRRHRGGRDAGRDLHLASAT